MFQEIIGTDPGTYLTYYSEHIGYNNDLELRQSVEIEEFERHSDDSDRRYYGPRPGKLIHIVSNALALIAGIILQQ
jgi:hypothetical protein